MNPILVPVMALAISMVVIPLMLRLAPALGFLDKPSPRKVHTTPTARVGGWGIVLGALVPVAFALGLGDPLVQSYVAGGLILWTFGSWDDSREISPYVKLLGQCLAAAVVVFHSGLVLERVPFLDPTPLPGWVGGPLTLMALVAMINAMNLSDGLDGLAGGEALLSLLAMVLLGYLAGGERTVVIGLAAIGSTLGFLRFNTHPARLFMGDSGSQFLGFTVGVLALLLSQVANTALGAAVPLLLLGLPAVDLVAVVIQRTRERVHWFYPTRTHLHHRLLDLGFEHREAVVIIYAAQALFVLTGVALRYASDLLTVLVYGAYCVAVFAAVLWLQRRGWQAGHPAGGSGLRRAVGAMQENRYCRSLSLGFLGAAVPLFLAVEGLMAASVPRDIALMAAVLLPVLLIELVLRGTLNSVTLRGVVYATMTFVIYLSLSSEPGAGALARADWPLHAAAFFGAVAVAVAMALRCGRNGSFQTTPMDYLVALVVLVLAFLPTERFGEVPVNELVIKAIIMLYACEIFLHEARRRWNGVSLGSLAALGIIAARGLL
jgi:UDP-GlcNAc:undecaprenyl-phosphate GlcNAc-1-phosphate transferase